MAVSLYGALTLVTKFENVDTVYNSSYQFLAAIFPAGEDFAPAQGLRPLLNPKVPTNEKSLYYNFDPLSHTQYDFESRSAKDRRSPHQNYSGFSCAARLDE